MIFVTEYLTKIEFSGLELITGILIEIRIVVRF